MFLSLRFETVRIAFVLVVVSSRLRFARRMPFPFAFEKRDHSISAILRMYSMQYKLHTSMVPLLLTIRTQQEVVEMVGSERERERKTATFFDCFTSPN